MIIDGFLLFTGTSNGATSTIADGANTDAPTTGSQDSSNIIDLGVKSGIPASASGGGARDIGIGDDPAMKLLIEVITAFTGGTSLAASLVGGIDNGSGSPTFGTTMWLGPVVAEANLLAGAYLANVYMPQIIPAQALPRFLKLTFVTVGTHNAGDLIGAIVLDKFEQIKGTGGAISAYPPGIVISN